MKRVSPLMRVAAWAGAVTTIVGALTQVWPPIWNWLARNELSTISEQAERIEVLEREVEKLGSIADGAIDASERRFEENEKHAIELRGSLESLRNEVRVRHGDATGIPTPAYAGSGRRASLRPATRREKLEMIAQETDDRLSKARVETPKQLSLRDAMQIVREELVGEPTSEPVD